MPTPLRIRRAYGTLPEPRALHDFNHALLLGKAGKKLYLVFSKEALI